MDSKSTFSTVGIQGHNGRRDLYVRTESPFPSSRHRILGPARGVALPTFDGVSVIYLKDITEAYPLSLLCMEINSNRLTWNRTRDDRLEGGSYIRLTMSP